MKKKLLHIFLLLCLVLTAYAAGRQGVRAAESPENMGAEERAVMKANLPKIYKWYKINKRASIYSVALFVYLIYTYSNRAARASASMRITGAKVPPSGGTFLMQWS